MDEVEYEDIELLDDEFHHALVGAVYGEDGTPVPCYSSGMGVEQFMREGMSEEEAVDYCNEVTEGLRILWIHPLELAPTFEPDGRPHLRLVH